MLPTLTQLYDTHAAALFAFLLNVTRSEPDSRDILQDVFLKLARRPQLLASARNPRAFLLRLAHNAAIDAIRHRASHTQALERITHEAAELFAPDATPGRASEADTFRAAVSAALAELPAEQRAIVHLKLWEDLTFAQIADALGIPANTAASRYRYALDKLRILLRPICAYE